MWYDLRGKVRFRFVRVWLSAPSSVRPRIAINCVSYYRGPESKNSVGSVEPRNAKGLCRSKGRPRDPARASDFNTYTRDAKFSIYARANRTVSKFGRETNEKKKQKIENQKKLLCTGENFSGTFLNNDENGSRTKSRKGRRHEGCNESSFRPCGVWLMFASTGLLRFIIIIIENFKYNSNNNDHRERFVLCFDDYTRFLPKSLAMKKSFPKNANYDRVYRFFGNRTLRVRRSAITNWLWNKIPTRFTC